MDKDYLILIPKLWKRPQILDATLKLTSVIPYTGIINFDHVGFGKLDMFQADHAPHMQGCNTHKLMATLDTPTRWFRGVHIILPEGYDIDWEAYRAEPKEG